MSRRQPFYVYVVDDDKHLFCVVGPIADDTALVDAVSGAQRRGRQVKCWMKHFGGDPTPEGYERAPSFAHLHLDIAVGGA
jgi:hypothetical protein